MKSANPEYDGIAPNIPGWPLPRPSRWIRRDIGWQTDRPAEPWYVGPFVFGHDERRLGHLHAAAHYLTDCTLSEPWARSSRGHFTEYFVSLAASNNAVSLVQNGAIAFGRVGVSTDVREADDLDAADLSDSAVPVWRSRTDTQWPTIDGRPMRFATSIDTINNPFGSRGSGDAYRLYVFYADGGDRTEFAVLEADLRSQTIEEHERDEEVRALWKESRGSDPRL